eukprot:79470-Prymnesium_polylepis.1
MCATRARHVATRRDTTATPPRHDCGMSRHARDTAATRSRHGVPFNDFSRRGDLPCFKGLAIGG